jgi:hypothetical protein
MAYTVEGRGVYSDPPRLGVIELGQLVQLLRAVERDFWSRSPTFLCSVRIVLNHVEDLHAFELGQCAGSGNGR